VPITEPGDGRSAKPRRGRLRSFAPVVGRRWHPCTVLLVVALAAAALADGGRNSSFRRGGFRSSAAAIAFLRLSHINDDVTRLR